MDKHIIPPQSRMTFLARTLRGARGITHVVLTLAVNSPRPHTPAAAPLPSPPILSLFKHVFTIKEVWGGVLRGHRPSIRINGYQATGIARHSFSYPPERDSCVATNSTDSFEMIGNSLASC